MLRFRTYWGVCWLCCLSGMMQLLTYLMVFIYHILKFYSNEFVAE